MEMGRMRIEQCPTNDYMTPVVRPSMDKVSVHDMDYTYDKSPSFGCQVEHEIPDDCF